MKMQLLQLAGAVLLTCLAGQLFAQSITTGTIKYTATNIKGSGMEAAMMKESTQMFYFNDSHQKMDILLMDGMVRFQIIGQNDGSKSMVLTEGLIGNVMVTSDEQSARENMVIPDYSIKYDNYNTKTIAGYKCKKATLTASDGTKIEAFVTEEIKPKDSFVQKLVKDLKGFPLEYTISQPGFSMTYTAQEVKRGVDRSVFFPDTSKFKEMTDKEWEERFGKLSLGK